MFVKVWTPFAVPIDMPVPAENVCVLEVEPLSEVMPVAEAGSHETPFGAVEEAVRTKPFEPTVFAAQVVPEATMRLPVEVERLLMSLIRPGKLKA